MRDVNYFGDELTKADIVLLDEALDQHEQADALLLERLRERCRTGSHLGQVTLHGFSVVESAHAPEGQLFLLDTRPAARDARRLATSAAVLRGLAGADRGARG